jgi:hypothetical protein
MRRKAAMHSVVIAASAPPATTTSALPRSIIRIPSPIACAPVAQAEATLKPGPCTPRRIATAPAAALGIIIGTKFGETPRSPRARKDSHCSCSVIRPPMPVPITTATRSGSQSASAASAAA